VEFLGQPKEKVKPSCRKCNVGAPGVGGMGQCMPNARGCPDDQHPRPRHAGVLMAHILLPYVAEFENPLARFSHMRISILVRGHLKKGL
jgi:hypothetical protein